MGGHGGLNILPQKRWHLYRRDNRRVVELDEKRAKEAAEQGSRDDRSREYRDRLTDMLRGGDASHTTLGGSGLAGGAKVNLFDLEEREHRKALEKHSKYLEDINHNERDSSWLKMRRYPKSWYEKVPAGYEAERQIEKDVKESKKVKKDSKRHKVDFRRLEADFLDRVKSEESRKQKQVQ